jgi:5-methylthioadenosine/S-adenosylhomocysteine deaminase
VSDLLVVGGDVVTMDAQRRVVTGATVAASNGVVAAIGAAADVRAHFPGAQEIDATDCIVIPGLIDAHQHTTGDPLVRSMIPDDISSEESIFDWIVPLHAAHDGDDDELSATITAVDALTRGVTTLLEPGTVAHPLRVAAGLERAGIRARVGGWGWDVEGMPFAGAADEVLGAQEETVKALGPGGLVTGWVTLVGHDLASDELFAGAADLAERLDVGLTLHMSPGENDIASYARRSGLRPVEHLGRLGVLGPRLVLGHAVWLDDAELDLVLDTQTAIASCPAAYLRLGQGYTRGGRHGEFVRRGGRLALGCDSHNAGDVPDVLHAAYLLAALERDRGTENALRADQAFGLATVEGARAVGLGGVTGSIEVGLSADLVVLDTRSAAWAPRGDLALQLVYGGASGSVRDVVVDGTVVVRDRRPTRVDVDALRRDAAERSAALLRRTGIDVPHRWPSVDAS